MWGTQFSHFQETKPRWHLGVLPKRTAGQSLGCHPNMSKAFFPLRGIVFLSFMPLHPSLWREGQLNSYRKTNLPPSQGWWEEEKRKCISSTGVEKVQRMSIIISIYRWADPFCSLLLSFLMYSVELRLSDSQGPFPFKNHPLSDLLLTKHLLQPQSYELWSGTPGPSGSSSEDWGFVITYKARAISAPGPSTVPAI